MQLKTAPTHAQLSAIAHTAAEVLRATAEGLESAAAEERDPGELAWRLHRLLSCEPMATVAEISLDVLYPASQAEGSAKAMHP
ncbi:MAG TPA: hypothetical protein VHW01_23555 [Polyangiaceae bacterium]|jgi:hypothetical protein|nr:hypothetical protein [Polyangiaceae bacterium]